MVPHAGRGRIVSGVPGLGLVRAGTVACVASLAALLTATSCSSSSAPPPIVSTPPACPDSFAAANGAACTVEGQSCGFVAACGPFGTPATCACTGGVFACSASILTADASPLLVPAATDGASLCLPNVVPPTCPSTERQASIAACTDLGQVCPYASPCSDIPAYDECQCVGGRTTTEGAHYECTSACEVFDAASPLDSGPIDASVADVSTGAPDSASDAPSDAARE